MSPEGQSHTHPIENHGLWADPTGFADGLDMSGQGRAWDSEAGTGWRAASGLPLWVVHDTTLCL